MTKGPIAYKFSTLKKGSSLKYRVEDIPPEGVLVQGEQAQDWLESLFSDQESLEFNFLSPLSYQIRVSRSDSLVFVAGTISLKVEPACSRCLERFIFTINADFEISLSQAQFQNLPLEMELKKEDLNTEFYDGDTVDLGAIIQNQIILAIPFNPLCREDCKGLCPHCGINKNQKVCRCSEKQSLDPRFSALKNFFKK